MTRKAVVIGATSGIGKACATRLAQLDDWTVIAVGRSRPGREDEMLELLRSQSQSQSSTQTQREHEFRACDAFSLKEVKQCADDIIKDHGSIDALVMTQGMATIQGFTPTIDGNDEKLTLHYWSRIAMASSLLPGLRKSDMPGGPVVLSILSGGVHSAYKRYRNDPELKKNYSTVNAADFAGFYTDLGLDALSRGENNERINFVHASPGFVKTNWGTEMPWFLRGPIRALQMFGRDAMIVADVMIDPILKSENGKALGSRPNGTSEGVFIMNHKGQPDMLTSLHSKEARDFVWSTTGDVLRRVGIHV